MKRVQSDALLAVMRAIRAHETDAPPGSLEVDGCSREQVDAALAELHRSGFVLAPGDPWTFGGTADLAGAKLTALGRELLEDLELFS